MSTTVTFADGTNFRAEVAYRVKIGLEMRRLKKFDVADWIGMTAASFSKRLNCRLAFDLDEIADVALAAGLLRDWILTGHGPMLDPDWCPHQDSNLGPSDYKTGVTGVMFRQNAAKAA